MVLVLLLSPFPLFQRVMGVPPGNVIVFIIRMIKRERSVQKLFHECIGALVMLPLHHAERLLDPFHGIVADTEFPRQGNLVLISMHG